MRRRGEAERKREVLWSEDRKKVREKRKIGEGRKSRGEGEWEKVREQERRVRGEVESEERAEEG